MCPDTGVSNELPGKEKAGPGPVALPGPGKGWDGVIEALFHPFLGRKLRGYMKAKFIRRIGLSRRKINFFTTRQTA